MDRLTDWDEHGNAYLWRGVQMMTSRYNRLLAEALDRLAEYEDTALSPEEVLELLRRNLQAVKPVGPCDLCIYNPPSSFDGKPCSLCPACGR